MPFLLRDGQFNTPPPAQIPRLRGAWAEMAHSGQTGTPGSKQCRHFSESLNYKDVFILLRIFLKTPKKPTTDVGKTARKGRIKLKRRGQSHPHMRKLDDEGF